MRLTLLLAVGVALGAQTETLPGTRPLALDGDLAARMLAGIDRYLDRETVASIDRRPTTPDRDRFRRLIGLVDDRLRFEAPAREAEVLSTPAYKVFTVRWPVIAPQSATGTLRLTPGQRSAPRAVPD